MKRKYTMILFFLFLSILVLPGAMCEKTKNVTLTNPTTLADEFWEETFSRAGGVNGGVYALVTSGTDIYAGGDFTFAYANNVPQLNRIGKWNGTSWEAMGVGANSTVWALAKDGQGNIYAGGAFTQIGTAQASYIARWNTTTQKWETVGNGVSGTVYALAFDSNGNLYVGGRFSTVYETNGTASTANNIARWDGSAWSTLGDATGNGISGGSQTVRAIDMDSAGAVYVGGQFTTASNNSTSTFASNSIAKWTPGNPGSWSALPDGGLNTNSWVYAIKGKGTDVYLGGDFIETSGKASSLSRVAKYDGTNWIAMSTGVSGGSQTVRSLAVDSAGGVYAGGWFTNAGGITNLQNLAKWTGSRWATVAGKGINTGVYALTIESTTGSVYAGGGFTQTFDKQVDMNRVGKLTGSTWSAFGSTKDNGPNGEVNALASDGKNIYVGGSFSDATNVPATQDLARYDASTNTWSAVAGGITSVNRGGGPAFSVYALATDSSGNLYVGTSDTTSAFKQTDGTIVYATTLGGSIARWNSATDKWEPLGDGVNGTVYAIAVDEANNCVYVGGVFTTAYNFLGGTVFATDYIAKWNLSTQQWETLGNGTQSTVYALLLDSSGNLYVGGAFSNVRDNTGNALGGTIGIARWNRSSSSWEGVGNGLTSAGDSVRTLVFDKGGNLYVGGSFTDVGNIANADYIALWNGKAWSAVGGGLNGSVRAFGFDSQGFLYIGGAFSSNNGRASSHITIWNGNYFVPMGSGADGWIYSITQSGGYVYVGGLFNLLGKKANLNLGRWRIP